MKKLKVNRIVLFLLMGIMMISLNPFLSFAATNEISRIDTEVFLKDDGSAEIKQIWEVSAYSGTEIYIPQTNMRDMELENLQVTDETGVSYDILSSWDVDRSQEDKKYKAGIHPTPDGFEICWGIGEYGSHRYILSYTLSNFVKSYTDYDGFNVRLVNDQLSSPPQFATIRISKEDHFFQEEEVSLWAFGFEGNVFLENGSIVAIPSGPLSSYHHMTVMSRFEKGIFHPTSVQKKSFSEIEDRAVAGSDYKGRENSEAPEVSSFKRMVDKIMFFNVFLIPLIFISSIVFSIKSLAPKLPEGKKMPKMSTTEYFRDVPLSGNFEAILGLQALRGQAMMDRAISFYLLRWIKERVLRPITQVKDGFLGIEREDFSLQVEGTVHEPNTLEDQFFYFVRSAAGSNFILEGMEFSRWARKNQKPILSWWKHLQKKCKEILLEEGYVTKESGKGIFGIRRTFYRYTEKGLSAIEEILGFQKYLKDFSLIEERGSVEVSLWDEFLCYASLFGLSDQVYKEFCKLYPHFDEQSMYRNNVHRNVVGVSRSFTSSATPSSSSSSSSVSGGGGSSGGGSGGGIR